MSKYPQVRKTRELTLGFPACFTTRVKQKSGSWPAEVVHDFARVFFDGREPCEREVGMQGNFTRGWIDFSDEAF